MRIEFFAAAVEWRAWLKKNGASARELWVGYYRVASGRPSMTWPESVDEALCFGWIDGLRKSIDGSSYKIRFTPRKEGSIWSAINVKRVAELIRLNRMTPAGLKVFDARDSKKTELYSYERAQGMIAEYEKRLKANARAWQDFESRAPWYRRAASHWVMSAKKPETREKRLATLIECCATGKNIPPLILRKAPR